MDFYHNGHEGDVQEHFDEACEELSVEHVDGLVVPRILTLQVDGVQNVLDEGRQNHSQQDGILESKNKLDRSSSGNNAVAGMVNKQEVHGSQKSHER